MHEKISKYILVKKKLYNNTNNFTFISLLVRSTTPLYQKYGNLGDKNQIRPFTDNLKYQ